MTNKIYIDFERYHHDIVKTIPNEKLVVVNHTPLGLQVFYPNKEGELEEGKLIPVEERLI